MFVFCVLMMHRFSLFQFYVGQGRTDAKHGCFEEVFAVLAKCTLTRNSEASLAKRIFNLTTQGCTKGNMRDIKLT